MTKDDMAGAWSGSVGGEGLPLGISTLSSRIAGAARPAGLALKLDGDAFRISVADAAGACLVELGPYDEDEVVAVWRSLAASSGLPLLVPGVDGALDQAYPQMGRLVLGPRVDRRRLAVLSGRRPRFLVRRKPARLPRRPVIYREKEMAAGRNP
ncbi:DUF6101 family protein [uncultured Enterovirga sp.]|uniref:DUF6101 family protein n=1 Tax=uncultured Enterovirga sp. TaxID=2026352 RepID=UPI0035CA6318